MNSHPKISVLVSARPDSKYLAKFLFGYFHHTSFEGLKNIEVLVCINRADTWNSELVSHFNGQVKFVVEDLQLGRWGLHEYFNILAKHASGDWLIYFCDDHFIGYPNIGVPGRPCWDEYFLTHIEALQLDPAGIYCLVPKFDNAGAMNHMLSRGYYEALGAMGRHGWIDSYINDINRRVFGDHSPHVVRFDHATFHDFTHDTPGPMETPANAPSDAALQLPNHGGGVYERLVIDNAAKLQAAIKEGA